MKTPPKRLQEWERQALLEGYLKGDKLAALASEFNCSTGTITMLAKRRGLPRRKLGWKTCTPSGLPTVR